MDHTAAPFVPRGSGLQPPTQPLTPPLAAQPGPGPLHFRNGPPYSAHYAPQAHQYAQLPPQYAAMPPPPSQPPAYRAPTKLRAGASEFVPPQKKSNTTTASPAKHADPTPTVVPTKSEESQLKLNASARPYSPNRGAPAFPATAPTSADAAAAAVVTPNTDATQGDTAFPTGTTPEPLSPVTPMSPTRDGSTYPTFKNSKLPVPEKPNAPTEVKLNSTWTLYADSHPISIGLSFGGGSFNASKEPQPTFAPTLLKNVGDMEGFWRLWRTIKPPSAQVASFTFFFFRRSINPTWEDARNKAGGTINVPLWDANRAGLLEREQVDDVWFLVTMLLAGESLPGANLFNGAVLKIRPRAITLQMWTNTSTQASLQPSADAFRQRLQQRFPQEKFEGLEFYSHANQEKAPASPVTPKPTAGGKAKKVQKKEADFKL